MIRDVDRLLAQLQRLHHEIRQAVVEQAEQHSSETLARVVDNSEQAADTIFAIDRVSEERLVGFFEREIAPGRPLLLVAEGLPDVGYGEGRLVLPRGTPESAAEVCILVDPIDGTRPYMYQKRPAWILTGIAPMASQEPDGRTEPRLRDIECALQTEIPLAKQHLCDELWALRGQGMQARRYNRLTGEHVNLQLQPSPATDLKQGFATVCRFVPGMRVELATIDEEIMRAALGPLQRGRAASFEDQYISSGGQLYELIAGHDRVTVDVRPLVEPLLARRGLTLGISAHPYDLSTALIASEAGVIVTDGHGQPLDAPCDVTTEVAWVGYANPTLRAQIEPLVQQALAARGLL
jgi:hypothetical protein